MTSSEGPPFLVFPRAPPTLNPPLPVAEMKRFMGVYFCMGVTRQRALRDHWQTKYPLNATPYSQVMSRNRWQNIWSQLNFANNNDFIPRGQPGYDRLFQICNLLCLIIIRFSTNYHVGKELALDEMIAFKGRSTQKQYNPKKPDKWGFKAFALRVTNGLRPAVGSLLLQRCGQRPAPCQSP